VECKYCIGLVAMTFRITVEVSYLNTLGPRGVRISEVTNEGVWLINYLSWHVLLTLDFWCSDN